MRFLTSASILLILSLAVLPGCALLDTLKEKQEVDEYAGWSADRFFREAKQALMGEAYQKAVTLYEKLEARYPFGEYSEQAQLDLAYAYYKNDEADSAIAAADRFISVNPRSPHVDYAHYLRALVNYNRGISFFDRFMPTDTTQRDPVPAKDAYQQFAELVNKFPLSIYANDARQRMVALRNNLAMHEAHVAEYYLRRGAYVATVKRCQDILRDYDRTPAVPTALKIMESAYRKLGMNDLAANTARIYAHNYAGKKSVVEDIRERTAVEQVWNTLGLEKDN